MNREELVESYLDASKERQQEIYTICETMGEPLDAMDFAETFQDCRGCGNEYSTNLNYCRKCGIHQ